MLDLTDLPSKTVGILPLAGEWELYRNRLLAPADFRERTPSNRAEYDGFIRIPGPWQGAFLPGPAAAGKGYATCRMRIRLMGGMETPGIMLPRIPSARMIFLDGVEVKGPFTASRIIAAPATMAGTTREFEIVLQVTASRQLPAAIDEPLFYGALDDLRRRHARDFALTLLFFSSIMIVFLYQCIQYLLNRQDRSLACFALFCVPLAITALSWHDAPLALLFPGNGGTIAAMAGLLGPCAALPAGILFLGTLYPAENVRAAVRALFGAGVLLCLVVFIAPASMAQAAMVPYHLLCVAAAGYALFVLRCAVVKKRGGARLMAGSSLLFIISALHDIAAAHWMPGAPPLFPAGCLCLVFTQAFKEILRLTNAVMIIEDLTENLAQSTIEVEKKNIQLLDLNSNLEEKVKSRTAELEEAMGLLANMNDNLMNACSQIEKAQEETRKDMNMAKRVQANFLPREAPTSPDWDIAFYLRPMAGVSGDFYDFYTINGKLAGVGLFDVSGHGVSSGLITTIAKSIIHRHFVENTGRSLPQVMNLCNLDLQQELNDSFHYLTGILLRFGEYEIEYVSAGHPDILIRSDGVTRYLRDGENRHVAGPLLGIATVDIPYRRIVLPVRRDDSILLYTDGLSESANQQKETFGPRLLLDSFRDATDPTAQGMLNGILERFYSFTETNQPEDDVTVMVLKRK